MADKNNIILEYAFIQFLNNGYSKVTMDDIARGCGIGKGTLYKYFESKELLMLSCIDYNINKIKSDINAILDNNIMTPAEKISLFIQPVLKIVSHVKSSNLEDIKRNIPEGYEKIKKAREKLILSNMAKVLKQGKEAGIFLKDLDIELEAHIMMAAVSHIADPEILSQLDYTPKQLLSKVISTIIKGCLTDKGRNSIQ